MRGGVMHKVIELLKSVWSLVMGIVLIITATVVAVMFAPLWIRIWLGAVGGLGLLLLAIRALLIRKDGDKS